LQEEKNSNRLVMVDTLKGIAILLVLWGHCIQFFIVGSDSYYDNIAYRVIYSFHMPLFMTVSGYLYWNSISKRSLRDVLVNRLRGIGVPALICIDM
jgi:fucose 4-O-acetylase-like acetyltransferase